MITSAIARVNTEYTEVLKCVCIAPFCCELPNSLPKVYRKIDAVSNIRKLTLCVHACLVFTLPIRVMYLHLEGASFSSPRHGVSFCAHWGHQHLWGGSEDCNAPLLDTIIAGSTPLHFYIFSSGGGKSFANQGGLLIQYVYDFRKSFEQTTSKGGWSQCEVLLL